MAFDSEEPGADEVRMLSEAFAFLGNSLLDPINQTPAVGIDPSFWKSFPCFGDDPVGGAIDECERFAHSVALESGDADNAVQRVAVDYARLFIGPPRPAAPPWETAYSGGNDGVGFGQPTFRMRERLREAGLEIAGKSNQYADHMGIELLLLSVLLMRAADGDAKLEEALAFAQEHPAKWIAMLRERVHEAKREGYYGNLLLLAQRLLEHAASTGRCC